MKKTSVAVLTVSALGIVYGDLGTSPLYTMNEVFFGHDGLSVTPEHIAGVASLIFWMLVIVIGIKYATLVLRADHQGEGGSFAMFSLLQQFTGKHIRPLSLLLMFAAGLLFGDGIITPAITVLSAIEGLKIVTPALTGVVVPTTILILIGVFFFQKQGTKRIGKVYGPIMLLWFFAIGFLGLRQILIYPEILRFVFNPLVAFQLLFSLNFSSLSILIGAAFLSLTGSEALYADMGHLGKRPIRVGWFFIVFPALVLNYAGQAAYLATGAEVFQKNIFYSIVPADLLIPMICLATAAAIIASVALIFGAYSLVSQAMALHLFPRLKVVHTNEETEGQIYIPAVNWSLFVGSAALVLLFGSATRLAAAYGFAVSGVMLITSMAMYPIARQYWHWKRIPARIVFGSFALIDVVFVIANSAKFLEGGYIPFLLGVFIFSIVATWRWGRKLLRIAYDSYASTRDMQWFIDVKEKLQKNDGRLKKDLIRSVTELDRAVVFLVSKPVKSLDEPVPVKLRVYLKRKGAIPKDVVLLNIEQERVPVLKEHYEVIDLGQNVISVTARFGFMENPDASRVLRELYQQGVFEARFHQCTIEVSEDEFIVDEDVPFFQRLVAKFFKILLFWSVPRFRYFGFGASASAGLSKTAVPVRFGRKGVRVEPPEFPLDGEENPIDPDTLQPTKICYTEVI
jgi:KUP system potassium uptake protein